MKYSSIAIVGGGASGALVAMQIARQAKLPVRVLLYEPDRPGAGVAYGTRSLSHLLNVPAGRMSADPDQPSHFLKWLNDEGNCAELVAGKRFTESDYVPRAIYGRYVASAMRQAFSAQGCLARLDVRPARAVDFIPAPHGGTVVSSDAETEDVSHVVLALGNLPPRDPLAASHPFFRSERYVPYLWQATDSLLESPDESIMIVGTGLTGIDAILSLRDQGHRGRVIVTSRGGRFPQPHIPVAPGPDWLDEAGRPCTVRCWFRRIREEVRAAAARGSDWRSVTDAMRGHTPGIWMELSLDERRRFLRHVRVIWESHRHRMPPSAWDHLQSLRAAGRIVLVPGRIRDFVEDEEGVDVLLQPRGKRELDKIRVARVVNCIGPESNFRQHFNDPLVVNLIARGVIHPDPLFLGLNATPDGCVIGADDKIFSTISLIGPPLRGILWETTAIPEIRVQAAKVAARALADLGVFSWEI